jgi:integrase
MVVQMPRRASELSDAAVRRLKWGQIQSGTNKGKACAKLHAVGGVAGLYLHCAPPSNPKAKEFARSWILKTMIGNSRPELGLGPYPEVTLSMAREKARILKEQIREGIDPRAERRAARSRLLQEQAKVVTFQELGRRYEAKKAREYKTEKQAKKLASMLKMYVYPHLGNLVVADIERAHIIKMLQVHWENKTETMTRVRAIVENMLDMAGAEGLRSGDNPARWKGNLDLTLPSPGKLAKPKHFAAMPVSELTDFYAELTTKKGMGALALRFAILTASRSGEVRGATWDEIDLDAAVWTIPAERMKGGRIHKVPLTADAIDILRRVQKYSDTLVFPAPRGGMLSDMTMTKVLKDMGHKVTQHGFRATFRTWAQEYTNYQEEVPELALAHVNSDRTRAAYARSELLEKRSKLMDEWQRFCREGAPKGANVRRLRA